MDIGTDNGLPVVPKLIYAKVLPKNFSGTIQKVEFNLNPSKTAIRKSRTNVFGALSQCSAQLSDHRPRRF